MLHMLTFYIEMNIYSWIVLENFLILEKPYLRDTVGLFPDHYNKVNIAIKQVTWIFLFPTVYKNVYLHCTVVICVKKHYIIH